MLDGVDFIGILPFDYIFWMATILVEAPAVLASIESCSCIPGSQGLKGSLLVSDLSLISQKV